MRREADEAERGKRWKREAALRKRKKKRKRGDLCYMYESVMQ
jgi:hypothetical protein